MRAAEAAPQAKHRLHRWVARNSCVCTFCVADRLPNQPPRRRPTFKFACLICEHTNLILNDTANVLITGADVVKILERLGVAYGLPAILRMDNGPEVPGRALAQWAEGIIDLAFFLPGETPKTSTSNRSACANETNS